MFATEVDLPMFRDNSAVICAEEDKLPLVEIRAKFKAVDRKVLDCPNCPELLQMASGIESSSFLNLSCNFCSVKLLNIAKLFSHVISSKHTKALYSAGSFATEEDVAFWFTKLERARIFLSDPNFKITKQARQFYYKDREGVTQGPSTEEQMQEWYRKQYFTSDMLIGIGQKEEFVPLSSLIEENGQFTPFTCKRPGDTALSLSVLAKRPSYLIPMLHPVVLPKKMFLSAEALSKKVEKLRSKMCDLSPASFEMVMSALISEPVKCDICCTPYFCSGAEFLEHIISTEHITKISENGGGVTSQDCEYWVNVLDMVAPVVLPEAKRAIVDDSSSTSLCDRDEQQKKTLTSAPYVPGVPAMSTRELLAQLLEKRCRLVIEQLPERDRTSTPENPHPDETALAQALCSAAGYDRQFVKAYRVDSWIGCEIRPLAVEFTNSEARDKIVKEFRTIFHPHMPYWPHSSKPTARRDMTASEYELHNELRRWVYEENFKLGERRYWYNMDLGVVLSTAITVFSPYAGRGIPYPGVIANELGN